jgi:hypothetical protein
MTFFDFNVSAQVYITALSTIPAFLCVILIASVVTGPHNIGRIQEKRLRVLKLLRILIYAILCMSQLGVIIVRVFTHGFPKEVQSADVETVSGLAAWLTILVRAGLSVIFS